MTKKILSTIIAIALVSSVGCREKANLINLTEDETVPILVERYAYLRISQHTLREHGQPILQELSASRATLSQAQDEASKGFAAKEQALKAARAALPHDAQAAWEQASKASSEYDQLRALADKAAAQTALCEKSLQLYNENVLKPGATRQQEILTKLKSRCQCVTHRSVSEFVDVECEDMGCSCIVSAFSDYVNKVRKEGLGNDAIFEACKRVENAAQNLSVKRVALQNACDVLMEAKNMERAAGKLSEALTKRGLTGHDGAGLQYMISDSEEALKKSRSVAQVQYVMLKHSDLPAYEKACQRYFDALDALILFPKTANSN